MTTWRKLLSPQTNKILIADDNSSCLSLSESAGDLHNYTTDFGKSNHVPKSHSQSELNRSKDSECNQKIRDLKSQMGKLKKEMLKYSSSSFHLYSPSKLDSQPSSPKKKEINESSLYTESKPRAVSNGHETRKIGSKVNYDQERATTQRRKHGGEENFLTSRTDYYTKKERPTDMYYHSELDEGSELVSESNAEDDIRSYIQKLYSELQAEKRKRKEIHDEMKHSALEKESLRQDLERCREEVSGLKKIILQSRKDLEEMANRLESERCNSMQLSDQLKKHMSSKFKESQRDIQTNRTHRAINFDNMDYDFGSNNYSLQHEDKKLDIGIHISSPYNQHGVSIGSKREKESRKDSPFAKGLVSRFNTEQKDSARSGLRQSETSLCDRSVQCDLQLEGLMSYDQELLNDIQELKEANLLKDFEINRLKESKAALVSAVQEIVKLLTEEPGPKKKAEVPVKQIAQYTKEFVKKIQGIVQAATQTTGRSDNHSKDQDFHTRTLAEYKSPVVNTTSTLFGSKLISPRKTPVFPKAKFPIKK